MKPQRKQVIGPRRGRVARLALYLLLPALMGGCPEVRNQSVDAIETATRGVLNAAFDMFFDQFRSDEAF